MTGIIGEIAALLTAVCWSFNSVIFTLAGKRVGSSTVNSLRLWIAFPALLLLHGALFGTLFPFDIELGRFFYLGLSGVIGFVIGDAMLFESFLLIGPRRTMLLALLVPVFGAFLAWVFLGETLRIVEVGSIIVTIGGVAWVVMEREVKADNPVSAPSRKNLLGIWLAVGGAAGQALGLLFSRIGLAGDYPAISATLVRVSVAGLLLVLFNLFRERCAATWAG